MNLRSIVQAVEICGLCLVVAFSCLPAWAQQDFSKIEITTTRLADGIYILEGAGGNIGVSVCRFIQRLWCCCRPSWGLESN